MNLSSNNISFRGKIKQYVLNCKYPHMADYVSEFSATDWYNREQIEEYQLRKLHALLDFAYNHVQYYHRVFDELHLKPEDIRSIADLEKLPLLTKEIIWREGANMYADVFLDGVKSSSTSGSTGQSLVFRKTATAREIEKALMHRYRQNGGVNESQRSLCIWGTHSVPKWQLYKGKLIAWLMNEQSFDSYNLSEENIDKIVRILQSGDIYYLRGYTSAVFFVAQVMNRRNIHITIPFISLTAEQLYDFQRSEIQRAMGPNIYNQYGCGECGALAMECSAHTGLHHAFEHSILEVLDETNQPAIHGRVILTNLDNYAMPLIRYENGDVVTLADKPCSCGRHSRLIAHIDGRRYDVLEGEPGHFAHGGFFDDCFLKVDLLNRYNIRQMRVVQKEQTVFCFQYVADMEIDFKDQIVLTNEYRVKLGESVKLLFDRRIAIPSEKSGKRHFVIPLSAYQKNPELYK